MRKYKKVIGSKKKRYGDYTQDAIKNAIVPIHEGNMSIRETSLSFNIPKSTLHRKLKGIQMRPIGHPPNLSPEEERSFVKHLIVVAEWGFPFSNLDLCLMVKAYLDKANRRVN
ncbi:jerky homolog-like [Paramuricea clavata]|uniref:Jerky homolog-like n=1 Tax=Paramuricea clavata TaxID=317549 RepID=A0A7D9LJ67_PARCT|nr:jerky homolog-like [Paramuricea clavata]